jgi:hypothetical protein
MAEWHCFHCGTGGNPFGFCVKCGGGSRDYVKRDKEHCRKCGADDIQSWWDFCGHCGVRNPLNGEYGFLCEVCGQEDKGQTGEYACVKCGLPRLHDEAA